MATLCWPVWCADWEIEKKGLIVRRLRGLWPVIWDDRILNYDITPTIVFLFTFNYLFVQ